VEVVDELVVIVDVVLLLLLVPGACSATPTLVATELPRVCSQFLLTSRMAISTDHFGRAFIQVINQLLRQLSSSGRSLHDEWRSRACATP